MKNGTLFIYGNGKRPLQHAQRIYACMSYIHIDAHMNAKWIQTNIRFVKHRPKELESDLFVYWLYLFRSRSRSRLFAHRKIRKKNLKKYRFLGHGLPSHIHYVHKWRHSVRWIKFALLSAFEYLKMRNTDTHTYTHPSRKIKRMKETNPVSMIAVGMFASLL